MAQVEAVAVAGVEAVAEAEALESKETVEEETSAVEKELKTFLKWVRKGNHKRNFNFEHIEDDYADVLNKYVSVGDLDAARWYAERYLGI